ncbi:unnamed protein product [Linum trigynum]|uniref:Cellulose synthase RING-type zinc finger domain-containing protein n=1 Tax=Linum trigynum TaxID=586398 RepID=A0AAV2GM20_9ROSI
MMEPGAPVCNTCGEAVRLKPNGELFVACHECNFSMCRSCVEYESKEGRKACLRCSSPYDEHLLDDDADKNPPGSSQSTMAAHLSDPQPQDVGIHARHVSTVSTIDSEMNDESGNPIWKNCVEGWKDKKSNKKKKGAKNNKTQQEPAEIPPEQKMEDKQPGDALMQQPLSEIVPMSRNKLTPYRL